MKKLLLILLLIAPLTVGALPTVITPATKVTFTAPTQNTDGSPLTDLAGYKLYWRTDTGAYSDANSVMVSDPTAVEILLSLTSMPDGDNYVTITAVNSAGSESDFAPEAFVKKSGMQYYNLQNAGTVPAAPFNLQVQ